jgi:hypothetical protein
VADFLLKEDGDYLLAETAEKIKLRDTAAVTADWLPRRTSFGTSANLRRRMVSFELIAQEKERQ